MRFSATQLESFRLFMQPDQDWLSEDELLATLTGTFVPTHKINLGQAFGRVLESPDRYAVPGGYRVQVNHETFDFGHDVMADPLACIDVCGVFEAKAVKDYGSHQVASKADHLSGARLTEFKTTLGSFDFDKYADSYQWRFMVDAFRPRCVIYRVFLLSEGSNGVIGLRGMETFNLFPYAALHDDCAALVAACADYATVKGIAAVFDERQKDAVSPC